jgi:hypothetical protein
MPQLSRFAPLLAVLVGSASALAAIGCSALVDLSGLSTGSAADATTTPTEGGSNEAGPLTDSGDGSTGTDGAPIDARADADAADPDPHVGPNLLADHSFESGCTWDAFQGTKATDTTARTGTKSCRICTLDSTTDYFTGQDPFSAPAPVVGATYRAIAWVRTAPGAAVPPGPVLNVRSTNSAPFTAIEGAASANPGIPFTDTWQRVEVTMKATKPAQQMDIFVGSNTVTGGCFLVDDVWLERLP